MSNRGNPGADPEKPRGKIKRSSGLTQPPPLSYFCSVKLKKHTNVKKKQMRLHGEVYSQLAGWSELTGYTLTVVGNSLLKLVLRAVADPDKSLLDVRLCRAWLTASAEARKVELLAAMRVRQARRAVPKV